MRLIPMQFNNYFNRIVKRYNTIAEYINHAVNPTTVSNAMYLQYNGEPAIINFKPNDDVETKQVIDWEKDWTPDYLLVVADTTTDIISRWFVTESKRTRGGQYLLSLRRDLIADNFEAFQESVALIQKGKPLSVEDVSIYNREDFNGNEIKVDQEILPDDSKTAWIIGYYMNSGDVTINIPVSTPDISLSDIEDWSYYDYVNGTIKELNDFHLKVTANEINHLDTWYDFDTEGNIVRKGAISPTVYNAKINPDYIHDAINYLINAFLITRN